MAILPTTQFRKEYYRDLNNYLLAIFTSFTILANRTFFTRFRRSWLPLRLLMKTHILFLFLCLAGQTLSAQIIGLANDTLRFGSVLETQADSQSTWIYNNSASPLYLQEGLRFGVYDSIPYWYTLTQTQLAPGDSSKLVVYFQPFHNIAHSLPLIIPNNSGNGPIVCVIEAEGRYSDAYYSSTSTLHEEHLKQTKTRVLNCSFQWHAAS